MKIINKEDAKLIKEWSDKHVGGLMVLIQTNMINLDQLIQILKSDK